MRITNGFTAFTNLKVSPPKRPSRHVSACRRMVRATASHPNESLSMDFMGDELYDGQRIKLLTCIENAYAESFMAGSEMNALTKTGLLA